MGTPPSSSRRKPKCHSCGSRMAGHKRVNGSPVCPSSRALSAAQSLISPPPSPPPSTVEGTHGPAGLAQDLSFMKLPGGAWVRRNPNWTSAPDIHTPKRHASPAFSLVPTVLVDDDGNTVRGSDAGDDVSMHEIEDPGYYSDIQSDSGSTERGGGRRGLVDQLADYNRSLVTIFRTKQEDIAEIQEGAKRRGLHTQAVFSPRGSFFSKATGDNLLNNSAASLDKSWWVFLGQNPSFVQEMAHNCQERGIPGVLVKEPVMEGPRMVTFLHLVLASILGGCVVVGGMSFL